MIFYLYCVKMKMSEREFWESSLVKVEKMIDIYMDEKMAEKMAEANESYTSKYFNLHQETTINSMREMEGFGNEQCL